MLRWANTFIKVDFPAPLYLEKNRVITLTIGRFWHTSRWPRFVLKGKGEGGKEGRVGRGFSDWFYFFFRAFFQKSANPLKVEVHTNAKKKKKNGWQGKFIVRTPDAFRCFYFLHDMTCDCIGTDIQGDLDNIQRWAIMNKMVIIKRKQNLCLSSVSDSENAWFKTNIKIMIWPLPWTTHRLKDHIKS